MRAAKRIATFVIAASLGAVWACSDSAQPLGSGDKVINDTAGEDVYSPPGPATPTDAGAADAPLYGYSEAGALNTCGSCTCDPTKNYCMSGGTQKAKKRVSYPLGGSGFGEPDAAPTGPPPAPCKIVDGGATWSLPAGNGCIPLPPDCVKTPTCDCLVDFLQPFYTCYLDCTPTPGFLEVYCPGS